MSARPSSEVANCPALSENEGMIHKILPVGPLQCNCSVIGDETTHQAMVIDPGDDIEDVLAIVRQHKLQVKQIVITHAHIDHVGGAMKPLLMWIAGTCVHLCCIGYVYGLPWRVAWGRPPPSGWLRGCSVWNCHLAPENTRATLQRVLLFPPVLIVLASS